MKKILTFLLVMICIQTMGQTPPKIRIPGSKPGIINANTTLGKNKKYYSEDKRYYLVFQEDGNLVVYKVSPFKAIWHTHTNGKAVKSCVFQGDGNLVLYDYTNKPLWDASSDYARQHRDVIDNAVGSSRYKSELGGPGSELRMQNDGNLVIYYGSNLNAAFWQSKSYEKN